MMIAMLTGIAQGQKATVQGHIEGAGRGTDVVVNVVMGNQVVPVDTVTTDAQGDFEATVTPQEATLYLLFIDEFGRSTVHVMLCPGEKVSLKLALDREMGYMRVTETSGSRNAELYKQFNETLYEYGRQLQAADKEYRNPMTSDMRKRELAARFQDIQGSQNAAVRKLLERNTDVLMSAFLVTYFDKDVETFIDLYEAIEQGLKKDYADNQFVKYVSSKVLATLREGKMAPEIVMKDPNGKERKLSDLRGKVVMIDFWASWCRPCRMENPNVVRLYKQYHSKGFEIFSVSLDKDRDAWMLAIDQDGLEWENHVSDLKGWDSSGGHAYGITSVPNTVLVDREGRIIARSLRGNELAKKLKEIFGE